MALEAVQSPSQPELEALSSSTTSQPLVSQKDSFAFPPTAVVTLATHPSAALLTHLFGSLTIRLPQSAIPTGQPKEAPRTMVHLAAEPELEAPDAYYVDSPSDEEEGAAVEAQVDAWMGDLELLYQE